MKSNLMDFDPPQAEQPDVRSGRSDWGRCPEMPSVGLAASHSREDWSNAPAITTQTVSQLVREFAVMREQIFQQFAEIQKRLSQREEPRLRRRRTKPTRKDAGQSVLPLLPAELSPISDVIENSKEIFNRSPDPSDDLVLTCSEETWRRATRILTDHALWIWEKAKAVIRPPVISAGPDGSIDLYWTDDPYGLLLNVPADPGQPATFYGDDAAKPDSNRTSGELDPTKPNAVGILMWLAYTAKP